MKNGFDAAKNVIKENIKTTIRNEIGGDDQRIGNMNVAYSNITFKHILLPIWISAYSYNTKVYRFIINGETGEVQGQRPYSAIKIALAIIAAILAIIVIKGIAD